MASKSLLSLSSLSTLVPFSLCDYPTSSPRSSLRLHLSKPTLIICCSSIEANTRRKSIAFDPHLSVSEPEPEGTGAAAPTRGDIFLERQNSLASSPVVLKTEKKRRREKVGVSVKGSRVVYSCYGCGAPLQTVETDAPGYVDPDTYELKKKHHQLRKVLCGRCRLLSHGHMVTAVGGNGGYFGGKQFILAEELRDKLSHLRFEKALIVKLVDIVDFNGSFLARIRDLAGANPIILVVTKVDLLPKGTDFNCIGDWVVEATMKKRLNVLSVHLTSSKSLAGIAGVMAEIQKEKKGRDVYILGAANVGKSAFISAFLKMMSYKDPVAAYAQRYKPIQSAVPGTTLGPIQINAFLNGGKLFDTPGVHLHHRQAAVVHSGDLPALAPQSRLRGQSFPNPQVVLDEAASGIKSNGLNGLSMFWGGLVRIDVEEVLPETCLTFYGPRALQIHLVPTEKADEFYQRQVGVSLTPPTGKEKADSWIGLQTRRCLQIKINDVERPACDIAISGLGWIAIEPMGRNHGVTNSDLEGPDKEELVFAVHVPKPVEIFIRPPMPVGKYGAEWYQYRELTEKEEAARPKWYF